MNTSYALDSYYAHNLDISMKTSSGDFISLNFANEKSASLYNSQDEKSTKSSLSFASMQSFSFSIKSNGLDAQDKKEIAAFMKKAEPYINKFLNELAQDAPKSPVTQLANKIADIFKSGNIESKEHSNLLKSSIVKSFDKAFQALKIPKKSTEISMDDVIKKIFDDAQKLLQKTLDAFNEEQKTLYA